MTKQFTCSCFIRKNTPEIRKRLEELGYKPDESVNEYEFPILILNHVIVDGSGMYGGIEDWMPIEYPSVYADSINCSDNEELFFALAALNDTDDYMQWFMNKTHNLWMINERKEDSWHIDKKFWHKATPSELIEHFNNKNDKR